MVLRTGKIGTISRKICEASRKPTTINSLKLRLKVNKPYLIEVCQGILELLWFRGEHWGLRGRDKIIIIFMMRCRHS